MYLTGETLHHDTTSQGEMKCIFVGDTAVTEVKFQHETSQGAAAWEKLKETVGDIIVGNSNVRHCRGQQHRTKLWETLPGKIDDVRHCRCNMTLGKIVGDIARENWLSWN